MMNWAAIYSTGPNGVAVFLFATLVLGGAASWATGRAVALTWKPYRELLFYTALLTLAVRFIHYALFHEPFLTPQNIAIDFLTLTAIAWFGYRQTRSRQMQTQYPWLYVRRGLLWWKRLT